MTRIERQATPLAIHDGHWQPVPGPWRWDEATWRWITDERGQG